MRVRKQRGETGKTKRGGSNLDVLLDTALCYTKLYSISGRGGDGYQKSLDNVLL